MTLQALNANLAVAKPSATYRMVGLAAERRAAGAPVISLTAGEPDFDTPAHIRDAAIDAIRSGQTRYTPVAGIRPLREAIASKFSSQNGIETMRAKRSTSRSMRAARSRARRAAASCRKPGTCRCAWVMRPCGRAM